MSTFLFFFQAEDGIRDLVRSRGLGDVYKRQQQMNKKEVRKEMQLGSEILVLETGKLAQQANCAVCLLYTSDAADERSSVDLGGRRIIKKKT